MKVEARLSRNLDRLKKALRLDENDDMIVRRFVALGQPCALIYIDGMSGGDAMAQHVMRPLLASTESLSGAQARALALEKLIEITELKTSDNLEELVQAVMNGQSALLMDTVDRAVLMDTRSYVRRSVSKPVNESVVVGPHEAFNESLRDNLTLLHRMLRTPRLLTKTLWVGTEISTQVSLCWLDGVCPQETLDELEKRVGAAAVDCVMSGGMLSQLIEDNPWSPFPQVLLTERPDRAVSFLLEGQALLLRDGSPFALTLPIGLWHFFHAPDDSGMRWQYGSFSRVVRLFGAACALLLPAVFLALVLFSPGAMPMTLLTSV
ncbi:MAG: spore germination protein, partial [Eubacteriales bacterium]|nr:spore germination protein [Eubacteriales bacterium]